MKNGKNRVSNTFLLGVVLRACVRACVPHRLFFIYFLFSARRLSPSIRFRCDDASRIERQTTEQKCRAKTNTNNNNWFVQNRNIHVIACVKLKPTKNKKDSDKAHNFLLSLVLVGYRLCCVMVAATADNVHKYIIYFIVFHSVAVY